MYLRIYANQLAHPWNNGKSGAKLDLTSSTTTGLQIHKFDHTRTANPCDWLPCRHAALLLVGYPHSLVYLHLPVVEGLIFCISATPHLRASFPLFLGSPSPSAVDMSSPVIGELRPFLHQWQRSARYSVCKHDHLTFTHCSASGLYSISGRYGLGGKCTSNLSSHQIS